jgi:DNA repair photolyase
MSKVHKHYRYVKKILRKSNLAGSFMCGRYSFSPYMACSHGCVYCDGRAEKYWVEGDFEKDIVVRKNLPELLSVELPKLRETATITIGSGISDAYQPPEIEEELMRRAAEIFAASDFPVSILTKSAMALRDLDCWKTVNERGGFNLYVSLTFVDDSLRRIFEPHASSVDERLELLNGYKEAGCRIGVMAMPLLPFISDTEENMKALFEKLKAIEVDFIMPFGLTLRPGRQKDFFMNILDKHFPDLKHEYERLYGNNLISGSPIYSYRKSLREKVDRLASEFEFSEEIPHELFRGRLPLYDEVYVLLCHMAMLYERKGIDDTRRLKKSTDRYRKWLLERKKEFNRRRTITQDQLEEEFQDLLRSEAMADILGNSKLSGFMSEVVFERKLFDYRKLELVESDRPS